MLRAYYIFSVITHKIDDMYLGKAKWYLFPKRKKQEYCESRGEEAVNLSLLPKADVKSCLESL